MAQYDETEPVFINQFISCNGELYSALLPMQWITDPIAGTGPKDCYLCRQYGHWNGVFIMHCWRCCKEVFEYRYGWGAIDQGVELYPDHPNSVLNTYLKDVDWDTIGEKGFEDSRQKNLSNKIIIIDGKTIKIFRETFPFKAIVEGEEEEEYDENFICEWKIDREREERKEREKEEFIDEDDLDARWFKRGERSRDLLFDISDEY